MPVTCCTSAVCQSGRCSARSFSPPDARHRVAASHRRRRQRKHREGEGKHECLQPPASFCWLVAVFLLGLNEGKMSIILSERSTARCPANQFGQKGKSKKDQTKHLTSMYSSSKPDKTHLYTENTWSSASLF